MRGRRGSRGSRIHFSYRPTRPAGKPEIISDHHHIKPLVFCASKIQRDPYDDNEDLLTYVISKYYGKKVTVVSRKRHVARLHQKSKYIKGYYYRTEHDECSADHIRNWDLVSHLGCILTPRSVSFLVTPFPLLFDPYRIPWEVRSFTFKLSFATQQKDLARTTQIFRLLEEKGEMINTEKRMRQNYDWMPSNDFYIDLLSYKGFDLISMTIYEGNFDPRGLEMLVQRLNENVPNWYLRVFVDNFTAYDQQTWSNILKEVEFLSLEALSKSCSCFNEYYEQIRGTPHFSIHSELVQSSLHDSKKAVRLIIDSEVKVDVSHVLQSCQSLKHLHITEVKKIFSWSNDHHHYISLPDDYLNWTQNLQNVFLDSLDVIYRLVQSGGFGTYNKHVGCYVPNLEHDHESNQSHEENSNILLSDSVQTHELFNTPEDFLQLLSTRVECDKKVVSVETTEIMWHENTYNQTKQPE